MADCDRCSAPPTPNCHTPLARAARQIIWDKYDGGPPLALPPAEWSAAVAQATRESQK